MFILLWPEVSDIEHHELPFLTLLLILTNENAFYDKLFRADGHFDHNKLILSVNKHVLWSQELP